MATLKKRARSNRSTNKDSLTEAQIKKIGLIPFDPSDTLSDPKRIMAAFIECMEEGEHEEARQVLAAGIKYMNKSLLSKRYRIPRRTLYNLMDEKRSPTLESVAKVCHALKQESLLAAKSSDGIEPSPANR